MSLCKGNSIACQRKPLLHCDMQWDDIFSLSGLLFLQRCYVHCHYCSSAGVKGYFIFVFHLEVMTQCLEFLIENMQAIENSTVLAHGVVL